MIEKPGTENFLFVYGTLMKNERNHRYLKDETFLGKGVLIGSFEMVSLSSFPAIIARRSGKFEVFGELYSVGVDSLHRMDALEGHPRFYRRERVCVEGRNAWTYILPEIQASGYPIISSGDWRTHRKGRGICGLS